ncbi:MAG: helix-hairpin-helix domain-containing protein [Myxococcota bacterium]|jgi:competence ComEA-like helix-hairpin-helix protein|nr:helix-hairpin-helix domain-containing protein [Myxococcota bacterium]
MKTPFLKRKARFENRVAPCAVLGVLCAAGLWLRLETGLITPPGPDMDSACFVIEHPELEAPGLVCGSAMESLGLGKKCKVAIPREARPCETVELGSAPSCPILAVRPTSAATRLICGRGIDLNADSAQDLEELPGIGKKRAEAIVQERHRGGPFESPSQLERIKGIGPKTVEAIAPFVERIASPN